MTIDSRVYITHYQEKVQEDPTPGKEGTLAYDVHIGNKALFSDGPSPTGLKIGEFRARQVSNRKFRVTIAASPLTGPYVYDTGERMSELDSDLKERAVRFATEVSGNTGLPFDEKSDIVQRTY